MQPSKKMNRKIKNIVAHSDTSEKALERYLIHRCEERGLPCLKYFNANACGYPDRLILLPDAHVVWVEFKSKGKKPTPLQRLRHHELREMGHRVEVIDNRPDIDALALSLTLTPKQRQ